MPALRSPIRSAIKIALRSPLDYSGAAAAGIVDIPAQLFAGGNTGLWYRGYSTSYLALNSDGTGGPPTIGQKFGAILELSGTGNHAKQATVASQGYFDGDCVVLQQKDAINIGDPERFYLATSGVGVQNNSTGIAIVDTANLPLALMMTSQFAGATVATANFPCRYGYIAWRTSPTLTAEVWIADIQATTIAGAISSAACPAPRMGTGATGSMRFREFVQINGRLNDTDFAALRNYAAQRSGAGTRFTSGNTLHLIGDSNTEGYRVTTGLPWPCLVAAQVNAKVINRGSTAIVMPTALALARNYIQNTKGSGKHVYFQMLGTNDVGASNGVALGNLFASGFRAAREWGYDGLATTYCSNISAGDWSTYRSEVRNRALGDSWNDLLDLSADPILGDATNATYFPDGLHMADVTQPIMAAAVVAKVTPMLAKPFTYFHTITASGASPVSPGIINASTGAVSRAWDYDNNGSTDSTAVTPTPSITTLGNSTVKLTNTNAGGSSIMLLPYGFNVINSPAYVTRGLVAVYIKGVGITAGISQWADQSGNGWHLVQATGANQPTDASGIPTFDGTNDYLSVNITGLTMLTSVHAYIKVNAWNNGNRLFSYIGATNNRQISINATSPFLNSVTNGSGVPFRAKNDSAYHGIFLGSSDNYSTYNGCKYQVDDNPPLINSNEPVNTLTGFVLGANSAGTSNASISCKFCAIYSVTLTQAEIAQNNAYFSTL